MGNGDTGISPEALLEHRTWLQRLAVRLVGDAQAADDLVQETFVTALRTPPEHADDPPRLRAWLARVARRASLQRARGEARRTRRQAETAKAEQLPPTDALVARAEMQRNVADAVVGLPEPYRTVVLLRYFEGLDAAEIARRLGAPAATVRSRLMRGLDLLRVELDRRYGGDRAAWCTVLAAFLPQGALPPPAPVGDGLTAPVLKGALAVKGSLQIVLACAAVVAAGIGAWKWSGAGAGARAADDERALEATDPLARPAPEAAPRLQATAAEPERLAVVAPRDPEEEPAAAPPAAATFAAALDARVVDEAGVGIVGARLEVRGPGAAAHSVTGGDVALDVPLGGERRTLELSVASPGRATRWLSASFRAGERVHLGDVELQPAGALSGRVVDEDGRPLGEVEVAVDALENARRDPEELRRLGPELEPHALRTYTEPDGGFRIEGVAVGSVRVWAGAEGYAWSSAGPVEVRRERETGGVELALAPLRLDDRIEGVVLDPDGAPVAAAQVRYWYVATTHATGGGVEADAEGRFSILVDHRVPHDLTVVDGHDRWSELHATHVAPGTRDLVLQFVEPSFVEIVAADAEGDPVEEYEVRAVPTHDEFELLEVSWKRARPEGRARLRRPTEAFVVRITARGYEVWESEPYPAGATVETVAARLVALPGVSGRVLAGDRPVAGAEVALRGVVGPGTTILTSGFFCTLLPRAEDEAVTDAEGYFHLFPRRDGSYHIVAAADGYAPTDLGPLEVRADEALEGIELELGEGGAIEGRVLVPAGADPSGTVVGLHRGDGEPRTVRVGADGRFRLERLAVGPWEVSRRGEELDPSTSSTTYSSGDPARRPEFNCEVRAGETTRFDLDLRDEPPCVLKGRFTAAGLDLRGWTASLVTATLVMTDELVDSELLGADGSFELSKDLPGRYRLVLQPPPSRNGRLEVAEVLELEPGERPWSLALEFGSVDGSGAPAGEGAEEVLEYTWQSAPAGRELKVTQRIVVADRGAFALPFAPAGAGRIAKYRPPLPGEPWGEWIELARFEVAAGEELQLLLP